VTADVEDFGPGPLPVIGAMCRECGLCDVVDDVCEWDEEQVLLPPRYRLTALIMNFLIEGQPMADNLGHLWWIDSVFEHIHRLFAAFFQLFLRTFGTRHK
jgi:hypothetical protein